MYLGNYLDADETYLNFSHPGVAPVFSALAFAESLGLSGEELIVAVALGYEVGCRVGGALEFMRQGPSGEIEAVTGNLAWYGFCIASAVGKALGFDSQQYNDAFGLVGWTAPIGTGQFFAPVLRPDKHMLKYTPVAFQGMSGAMAAQLAHHGFAGEQDLFDAPEEFWVAFGALALNRERLLDRLGETWQVSRTSFKPYSLCRYGHPAVSMVNKIMKDRELRPEEIESVVVRTFDRGVDWLGPDYAPKTPTDMQFNIPIAVAAAVHGSDLGPSWQTADSMNDPRHLSFAEKVTVEGHEDAGSAIFEQMSTAGRFQRIPNGVQIEARGEVYSDEGDYAWGDPWLEETRMTDVHLKDKFRSYAVAALPAAQSEDALDAMFTLEQLSNVTEELLPLLRER